MRLIADTVAFTVNEVPSWNPINVCSYHLQEAGATPVQEIAYALSTAVAVLDEVARAARSPRRTSPACSGGSRSSSTRASGSSRSTRSSARWARLWEEIGRRRYGVTEPKYLRMRYGVQVNSLGLTESQPENNVPRIVLEALAVTLGRDARARAIQLPAWNEALGLPRPWDQQWSLRIQQILANETDLLDYPDIFEGSKVMDGLVDELAEGARAEMEVVEQHGGAVEAVPYMKARLVESHRERRGEDRAGRDQGRGPELLHRDRGFAAHRGSRRRHPDPRPRGRAGVSRGARELEGRARSRRRSSAPWRASPRPPRTTSANIMPATIEAAKAGATTGEWAGVLRDVFGDYRAPTGVGGAAEAVDGELLAAARDARRRGLRAARAPAPHPGRKAGARRALERRRADRRSRPRRRAWR